MVQIHSNSICVVSHLVNNDKIYTEIQTPQMLKEAQALKEEEKEDAFLSEKLLGAPLTAYRFLSLAGRLTMDLMKDGLETILSPMRQHEAATMRHHETF